VESANQRGGSPCLRASDSHSNFNTHVIAATPISETGPVLEVCHLGGVPSVCSVSRQVFDPVSEAVNTYYGLQREDLCCPQLEEPIAALVPLTEGLWPRRRSLETLLLLASEAPLLPPPGIWGEKEETRVVAYVSASGAVGIITLLPVMWNLRQGLRKVFSSLADPGGAAAQKDLGGVPLPRRGMSNSPHVDGDLLVPAFFNANGTVAEDMLRELTSDEKAEFWKLVSLAER
jgi:hypothetical protein